MTPEVDFEVNTDAFLVDPDWDEFASQHDQRYGLAIKHLKSLVRGQRFDNDVMKLRVGEGGGFYAQSRRFPAAFYGDTALAEVRHVGEEEARAAVWDAVAHYRAGEAQSLTCIYSEGGAPDVFFGYRLGGERRYEFGALRSNLPLHLRVLIDAESPSEALTSSRGVLIYQRLAAGQHLMIRARGRRQPYQGFGETAD
jgi:hypothetical protein